MTEKRSNEAPVARASLPRGLVITAGILGALGLFYLVCTVIILRDLNEMINEGNGYGFEGITAIVAFLVAAIGGGMIAAAYGLIRLRGWARTLATIATVPSFLGALNSASARASFFDAMLDFVMFPGTLPGILVLAYLWRSTSARALFDAR